MEDDTFLERKLEKDVPYGCVTKRIACVGFDWSKISVEDIFKVFNSVVKHFSLRSVGLHRTKIGREMIGEGNIYLEKEMLARHSDYYVAIAEFESVEDSICVYNIYDGCEFERSGMFFDLRFVSEEVILGRSYKEAGGSDGNLKVLATEHKDAEFESNSEANDEENAELMKLFEKKAVDFDAVLKFVDISDDGCDSDIFGPRLKGLVDRRNHSTFEEVKTKRKSIVKRSKRKMLSEKVNVENDNEHKGFKFDPSDKRFKGLFDDDDFQIDPTHPEYKKPGVKEILTEKQKRFQDEHL